MNSQISLSTATSKPSHSKLQAQGSWHRAAPNLLATRSSEPRAANPTCDAFSNAPKIPTGKLGGERHVALKGSENMINGGKIEESGRYQGMFSLRGNVERGDFSLHTRSRFLLKLTSVPYFPFLHQIPDESLQSPSFNTPSPPTQMKKNKKKSGFCRSDSARSAVAFLRRFPYAPTSPRQ